LAMAFAAMAVLNRPRTRDFIGRLRADTAIRHLCGWQNAGSLPHELKFSRAFAENAYPQLSQKILAWRVEFVRCQAF